MGRGHALIHLGPAPARSSPSQVKSFRCQDHSSTQQLSPHPTGPLARLTPSVAGLFGQQHLRAWGRMQELFPPIGEGANQFKLQNDVLMCQPMRLPRVLQTKTFELTAYPRNMGLHLRKRRTIPLIPLTPWPSTHIGSNKGHRY